MGQENTLISVTVCVRNGIQWIDGCLEALKNQTYRPLEIIAVDDGSIDASSEIAEKFAQKKANFKYFKKKNEGLSSTRNFGISKSSGESRFLLDLGC